MLKQIIFFSISIAIFSTSCIAAPVHCGTKPITLAFFDYGLFHYNENGQSKGISPDVVHELRKRTNCEITSFVLPRARTWSDLDTGHLDMTVDGIVNEKRKSFGWFIPYNKIKNYALIKTKSATNIQSAKDFRDHKKLVFGVVRSFNHGEEHERWLKKMRAENRVEESVNIGILFNKFKLGRVDAIFAPPVVYRKFLKELKMKNDVIIQDWAPLDKGILAALVLAKNRFSQEDAKDWENLILQMQNDGTFKQIFSRHLSQKDANWMADLK